MANQTVKFLLAAIGSIPLSLFVMITYLKKKKLRQHPGTLMFGRAISHLLLAVWIILWEFLNGISNQDKGICAYVGTFSIVFLFASSLYFIGMCYSIIISFSYPLYPLSSLSKRVHLISWLFSFVIIFCCYFTFFKSLKRRCIYKQGHDRLILIISILYFIGVLHGFGSALFAYSKLHGGLSNTFELRKKIIRQHTIHAIGYVLIGIIGLVVIFVVLGSNLEKYKEKFSKILIAMILGNPLLDAFIWYLSHFYSKKRRKNTPLFRHEEFMKVNSLRNASESLIKQFKQQQNWMENKKIENELEEKTISDALRKEIILAMIDGIREGCKLAQTQASQQQDMNVDIICNEDFPKSLNIEDNKNSNNSNSNNISNTSINKFNVTNEIEFTDYAPHVFRVLKEQIYKIDFMSYLDSFLLDRDDDNWLSNCNFSEGKSGAFFFMTPDSKYFIKSVRNYDEAPTMLNMIPGYFQHYKKYSNSFINKYTGFHKIKIHGSDLYFVVMNNIFVPGFTPHERYDLKGSFVRRVTNYHLEVGKVLKDRDFHKTIKLPNKKSLEIWRQLKIDTKFLEISNVMDYSLMVGIYNIGIDSSHIYRKHWAFAPLYDTLQTNKYNAPKLSTAIKLTTKISKSTSLKQLEHAQQIKIEKSKYDKVLTPLLKPTNELSPLEYTPSKKRNVISNLRNNGSTKSVRFSPSTRYNDSNFNSKRGILTPKDSIYSTNSATSPNHSLNEKNIKNPLSQLIFSESKKNLLTTPNRQVNITHDINNNNNNNNINNINNNNNNNNINNNETQSKLRLDSESYSYENIHDDTTDYRKFKTSAKGIKKKREAYKTGNKDMRFLEQHESTVLSTIIEGAGLYCFGIIDILQPWNYIKKFERFYKVNLCCDDGDGLSCMDPSMYRNRFLAKMLEIGIGSEMYTSDYENISDTNSIITGSNNSSSQSLISNNSKNNKNTIELNILNKPVLN